MWVLEANKSLFELDVQLGRQTVDSSPWKRQQQPNVLERRLKPKSEPTRLLPISTAQSYFSAVQSKLGEASTKYILRNLKI